MIKEITFLITRMSVNTKEFYRIPCLETIALITTTKMIKVTYGDNYVRLQYLHSYSDIYSRKLS